MPTIATVFGMTIKMFYNDHQPPHFHVFAPNFTAYVELTDIAIRQVRGQMRRRDAVIIEGWARDHLAELWENWTRARQKRPLNQIGA